VVKFGKSYPTMNEPKCLKRALLDLIEREKLPNLNLGELKDGKICYSALSDLGTTSLKLWSPFATEESSEEGQVAHWEIRFGHYNMIDNIIALGNTQRDRCQMWYSNRLLAIKWV